MIWRFTKYTTVFVLIVFALPSFASIAIWKLNDHGPNSWREADWSSSGMMNLNPDLESAEIHVLAARTGRIKGALSVHSWLLLKVPGETKYRRYDVVGWGTPVRLNAYAADARWYSNLPEILYSISGMDAARLIPSVKRAIEEYPHSNRGDYVLWPGPNSNSFVAHILDEVPEIGFVLPANAVGRNYSNQFVNVDPDWTNFQFSLRGYAGIAVGRRHGFEINILGLTSGLDFKNGGLKLPGFGTISLF